MRVPAFSFLPVSQLTRSCVSWLWNLRLGLGKLAILDGDPGLGKSLLALDLCARLSRGQPMPDGSPCPGPASSLVLNGEDGNRDTVGPRLQALGADLDRVYVQHHEDDDRQPPLRLPTHIKQLDQALKRTGARLLVIDPLMAFLSRRVAAANDQSIRRTLLPLAKLAEKHSCVVLLIRHINKNEGGRSLYRGSGSIGLLGACRSGWLVARHPEQPDRCVLAQVKNNLAPPQPSLMYTVVTPVGSLPQLSWLGPTPLTADHLLAPSALPRLVPGDRARQFLLACLDKGPRTSQEIWHAARQQGIAPRTLCRIKRELEIRSVRHHIENRQVCWWLLPGQQLPAIPEGANIPNLEPWIGPLCEKYPPSTPIDDL